MNRENWLKFSLLFNLVLASVIGILLLRTPRPPSLSAVSGVASDSKTRADRVFTGQPNPAPGFKARGGGWRDWIGDLRAAGVPDNVIAGLVVSQFEENWQKRVDDLQKEIDNGDADPDAFQELAREHEDAEADEVRAALGESGYRNWDMGNQLRNLNLKDITVSAGETNALYELEKNLHSRQRALDEQKQKGEIDDAGYSDAQGKVQEEFNQKLKAILGEARYATMQGGNGEDAGLKRDLKKLNASDEQFASMLQAQRDWTERRAALDKQLQDNNAENTAYQQQLQAIDATRDAEYQRVLGTNGFDTLQMEQDSRYAQMKKYESVWGINDADINYAYQTMRYYEQGVQNYRQQEQALEQQGQTVDWDAVNKNLQQFSQQTEQALRSYLGDHYDQIQRNGVFPFGANAPPTALPAHPPPTP